MNMQLNLATVTARNATGESQPTEAVTDALPLTVHRNRALGLGTHRSGGAVFAGFIWSLEPAKSCWTGPKPSIFCRHAPRPVVLDCKMRSNTC